MLLCAYKDSLGVPNEGIHKSRVLGIAANDLIGLILLIVVIVLTFKTDILTTSIVLILITIFIHWLFCVPTAVNKVLGLAQEEQKV